MAIVDGTARLVDLSSLDGGIHAVQWYDTVGEVEYKYDFISNTRKPNERISDFAPYQTFADLWTAAAPAVVS